jgi:hypothetical protein
MIPLSFEEINEKGLPVCSACRTILENEGGSVEISGFGEAAVVRPRMWRHSERDVYHAWVYMAGRHVFLCGTDEFDERTLKRVKPLKLEKNISWQVAINGKIYTITDYGDDRYEILNPDGSLVKDEEIEARVFNYMTGIR